ncbi:hypothetical protein Hanom_Chr07g00663001 [Helianthus anomalus]
MLESEQLVKEIVEHAMKKRVRVERLKSLKKKRAVKASPAHQWPSHFFFSLSSFFKVNISYACDMMNI